MAYQTFSMGGVHGIFLTHFYHKWKEPVLFYRKQKSKRAIEDHFDKNVELELELEKKAKGLGHAIYCAKTFVGNEPFNRLVPVT